MIRSDGLGAGCHNTSADLPNLADVRLNDREECTSLLRRANQVKVTIERIEASLRPSDVCSYSSQPRALCAGCQPGGRHVSKIEARAADLQAQLDELQTWYETAQVLLNPPPN